MIRMLYFAWLRDRVGLGEEMLDPPAGVATAGALLQWLRGLDDAHREALADLQAVRLAVNQEFADPDTPISAGDEVAIFPPVTGG